MSEQLDIIRAYMERKGTLIRKPKAKPQVKNEYFDKMIKELKSKRGTLTRFSELLVSEGLFISVKGVSQVLLEYSTTKTSIKTQEKRELVKSIYEGWKGKTITKDVEKWNDKLSETFENIEKEKVKEELENMVDCLHDVLKLLTLGIKHKDESRLKEAKELLESAIYGGKDGQE